jgi:hypothetical protein
MVALVESGSVCCSARIGSTSSESGNSCQAVGLSDNRLSVNHGQQPTRQPAASQKEQPPARGSAEVCAGHPAEPETWRPLAGVGRRRTQPQVS